MDVRVHNLTKIFGALRANDAISLRFVGGQIHGVLGENGAGKSTLMKLLSGFLRADGGTIELDGVVQRFRGPADALRAGVGMVHQDPLDVPAFSALENFFCASPRWALPQRAEARNTLRLLVGKLGFSVEPDAPVANLTVGQRQQLEIVRLLACGARLLILDEPTTGISASQARALFAALRTLVAEGNTVLFVSHKLEEVAALCDTVSVLRAGRLVAAELPMPQPQAELLAMMFGREQEPRTENPEPSGSDHRAQRTIANPVAAQQAAQERAQRTVPIWELRDVTLREGAFQLSGLSYRIAPGSVVGLAGLEGSGQQLLLRALSGRLPPIRGTIELDGVDMTRARAAAYRRAGVEYLPADRLRDGMIGSLSLADHFTLEDRDPARLLNRERADQRAQRAITDYAIKALPSSPIAALSGGNQQRAMLALLPDRCRGILCEQPTRGLDIASAHAIWQRLLGRRSDGTAIIFASADLDELLAYSDHVLVFFGGKVSLLLPRSELDATRLAELIGGVGFVY